MTDLTLAALTETIARAIRRYPEQRGRIVASEGGRAIEDERCRLLDEQIARLRANLPALTFRETVAA